MKMTASSCYIKTVVWKPDEEGDRLRDVKKSKWVHIKMPESAKKKKKMELRWDEDKCKCIVQESK